MISFYKTIDNKLTPLKDFEEGCWVNVVNPAQDEIERLVKLLSIDQGFLSAALDEEETSRIESEDNQTLIIFDVPFAEKRDNTIAFSTMPVGVIFGEKFFVTVCLKECVILNELTQGLVKNVYTNLKTQFFLILMLRMSAKFLQYLRQIDKISNFIEKQLHGSLKNKELIQLLGLEKSLVYFSTSLKANEITLEKILRGRVIKLYDEDQELLEDVIIEVKQAIEMSNIYSSILTGTMDAFASVISNNLNIVMKVLTSITIVLAIPTIIFSFYGMNTSGLPLAYAWFPLILAVLAMGFTGGLLYKKNML